MLVFLRNVFWLCFVLCFLWRGKRRWRGKVEKNENILPSILCAGFLTLNFFLCFFFVGDVWCCLMLKVMFGVVDGAVACWCWCWGLKESCLCLSHDLPSLKACINTWDFVPLKSDIRGWWKRIESHCHQLHHPCQCLNHNLPLNSIIKIEHASFWSTTSITDLLNGLKLDLHSFNSHSPLSFPSMCFDNYVVWLPL